ncbi:MAG: DUF480 domain-containing protein [Rhizobiaceae bacterium]|nr:DUF480 domain-containing protein [Rhizobiaceae bacterium]
MSELFVLSPVEARILGCLIEKKETTPDVYPLTMNALQTAANQKTSRDPVMSLESADIHRAITQLEQKGLVRRAFASRVERFEHRLAQELKLLQPQCVIIALLLLRGPQTAHELMSRSERMANFASIDDMKEQLDLLIGHVPPLVVQLDRAPGQREERFAHLLCGEVKQDQFPLAASGARTSQSLSQLEARIEALEEEVRALRAQIDARNS